MAKSGKLDNSNLWTVLRHEAEKAVDSGPALTGFLTKQILTSTSFAEALCTRLATRLVNESEVPLSILIQTFKMAYDADRSIIQAAQFDLLAVMERDPAATHISDAFLHFKGYHAIQTHRIAHWLWKNGHRDMALYLQSQSSMRYAVDIHPGARLGQGMMMDHATGVVIGETAVVGNDVSMLHAVTLGGTGKQEGDRHPKIGDGVLIGAGAKILGNIHVGAGSRVAAGSVVLADVPDGVTVVGSPARIVGNAECEKPGEAMEQVPVFLAKQAGKLMLKPDYEI